MLCHDFQAGPDRWSQIFHNGCKPVAVAVVLCAVAGCDQIASLQPAKPRPLAEQAAGSGDYPRAVRLFEAALDGTADTADVHQRLAIIYDSHLKDPVSALHHYRRYSRMLTGQDPPEDVARSIERLERELANRLGEGGLVSRGEAVRLRNENLALRQQIAALRGEKPAPRAASAVDARGFSTHPQTRAAEAVVGNETRTYTVQKGDTLAAISRKFYNTSNRWKDIADANQNQLGGGTAIREGQVLIIP